MYFKRRLFHIIVITTAIVQSRAEDDKQPVLGLSGSSFLQRSSEGLNVVRKKEQNTVMNHIRKRALKGASTNIFDKAIDVDDEICCCDDDNSDDLSPESTPSATQSLNPSTTPSLNPTLTPSLNPTFSEKKIIASDGADYDNFGWSCSISDDLVVVGAPGSSSRAAYLFNLDGTELQKLTASDANVFFGYWVAMDEKIVIGTVTSNYFEVFSRDGIYERTITCNECSMANIGPNVATYGNKIVTRGIQNSINKLFIYSTEDGQLLKVLDQGSDLINDVAISEQFIVATGSKTFIYSNTSPDFTEIAEINQGGETVAVSGERIVIGDKSANDGDGAAWLYKTDGELVTALDRQDASSGSVFGWSVAITDDKVIVGAREDNGNEDNGNAIIASGSVFFYSAVTGEFIEKVLPPDAEEDGFFGSSVCASDSYFMVGAMGGSDNFTGEAYLFQLS